MKVIAFYLPQFHEIPENNKWWGEGFTEWVNVRKSKPLFEGHRQPRVPLNENYYDLSDINVIKWQTEIAKKYGIYGFCFYHYWFNGHLLLEKPVENFLHERSIDMPFCICWANEHWTNGWVSSENKVLIEQSYGQEAEWKEHYDYLKQFLQDSRYIKIDNKPLIVIYRPDIIDCISDMISCWKKLAIADGFDGLVFAYQSPSYDLINPDSAIDFDYDIEYQPGYARAFMNDSTPSFIRKSYRNMLKIAYKLKIGISQPKRIKFYDYNQVWNYIIKSPPISNKSVPCAFVDWDNTPRRGESGVVFTGMNPETFGYYFKLLVQKGKEQYHKDFMFIFAWNEWAEGGYLEPDEENGFRNLEEIKNALLNLNEFPD